MAKLNEDGTSPLPTESKETGEKLEAVQSDMIDDILSDFEPPAPEGEAKDPTLDPPGVRPDLQTKEEDATKESVPKEEKEIFEPAPTEGKAEVNEKSGEEEVTDDKPFVMDEMAEMRLNMTLLTEKLTQLTEAKAAPAETPKPKEIEAGPALDLSDLLTDAEVNNFSMDPKGVLTKLATRLHGRISEDLQGKIPNLVNSSHQRQSSLNDARVHFQTNNPQLATIASKNQNVQDLIRVTANKIAADEPALTPIEVFDKTAKRVSQTIGLARKAKETEAATSTNGQPKKPRSKQRAAQGDTDTGTAEQREIADLLDL